MATPRRFSKPDLEMIDKARIAGVRSVWSQDFLAELLAPGCALLTYRSALVNAEGELEQHTNRSSIWQLEDGRWLLRFHQGTPTGAFERLETDQERQEPDLTS